MSKIQKIWSDFLLSTLNDTFGEFLSKEEIIIRSNWILSNLSTINPDIIYKNILYMLNDNSLSKIAVSYKLHFILDDYKELFKNPCSEEFDKNPNLSDSDKLLLNELIHNFSKSINHHIELLIHNSTNSNLYTTVKELSKYYKLPNYESMNSMYIKDGNVAYKMNLGQILYMVSFNQNPYTSNPCSNELSINIKNHYSNRLLMMDILKSIYPSGIPLKYVLSKKIF